MPEEMTKVKIPWMKTVTAQSPAICVRHGGNKARRTVFRLMFHIVMPLQPESGVQVRYMAHAMPKLALASMRPAPRP